MPERTTSLELPWLLGERRRMMRFAWPFALSLLTFTVLAAGYFGLPPARVADVLQVLFAIGVTYFVLAFLIDRLTSVEGGWWLMASPLAMTVALALTWHALGAMTMPAFVVFMALPVLLAGTISPRILPITVAVSGVAMLVVVALANHAEARWFLLRWGLEWPTWLSVPADNATENAWTSSILRPDRFFGIIAISLLGVALIASMIGSALARLFEQYLRTRAVADQGQQLAHELLESDAVETVVVAADTATLLAANRAFARRTGLDQPIGKSLFALVRFSREAQVRRALKDPKTMTQRLQVATCGGISRLILIQIAMIKIDGKPVVRLQFAPPPPSEYLAWAAEEAGIGQIVLDADDCLTAANATATALFPGLATEGVAASEALAGDTAQAQWWNIRPRRRLERDLPVGPKTMRATITRQRPYGADDFLTFITLRER